MEWVFWLVVIGAGAWSCARTARKNTQALVDNRQAVGLGLMLLKLFK